MQDQYALRNKYPEFIFESFSVEVGADGVHANFLYRLGEYEFKPTVSIAIEDVRNRDINIDFLSELFFNFGIINAINYYKLTCAPKFVIKAGKLTAEQREFFKKLFFYGLGEFMYVNKLDLNYGNFLEIVAEEPTDIPHFELDNNFSGNLITVGGGKDSIVAIEALEPMREQNIFLQYNRNIYPPNEAALNSIRAAGYALSEIVDFNLTLDQKMLDLNKEGYYNGHIPFSSCLAFASLISAYLNNRAFIVLSNEASANEGNIAGTGINHQYSKSFEFENDFQNYVAKYLTDKIYYFSILRCFNEFEIVQKFLKFRKYLDIFRSCNVGTRENKWCSHCAKCLYVYIMLAPFVEPVDMIRVFDHNLLDDKSLLDIFIGLINPDVTKPFECVGTREEIDYSLRLYLEKLVTEGKKLPALIEYYRDNIFDPNRQYNIAGYFNQEHHIPEQYLKMVLAL